MPTLPPQPHLSNTIAAADATMAAAHQEEGWPLGLRPLDVRAGNRSLSYSTLLTSSPSHFSISTDDFDSESSGSFSPGHSVTLGSLMGVSDINELSRRSEGVRSVAETSRWKVNCKSKNWCFLLCSKLNTDAVNIRNAPSLGHFLRSERETGTAYRRRHNPLFYSPQHIQQEGLLSEGNYIR